MWTYLCREFLEFFLFGDTGGLVGLYLHNNGKAEVKGTPALLQLRAHVTRLADVRTDQVDGYRQTLKGHSSTATGAGYGYM